MHGSSWPLFCRLAVVAAALAACNDHPLVPAEAVFASAMTQTFSTPARPQVDFLFVIDDSGSMAEEQESLARNFDLLARLFQEDLGGRVDLRVAVTDTDLRAADRRGTFIAPGASVPGCEGLGPILAFGPDTDAAGVSTEEMARRLGCLTTLGTQGSSREKGLEAMRLALSCDGPNAALFAPCCVPGPDGRPVYHRDCVEIPAFLRPDALLAVVFLSDEDDCSDPAANPAASRRALCRTGRPEPGDCEPGEPVDACRARHCDVERQALLAICRHGPGDHTASGLLSGDQDLPAAYADREYCPLGDRAACFAAECGGLDAGECHAQRCAGRNGSESDALGQASLNTCQWFPNLLTPVEDYRDFLADLKVSPTRQLVVAAITGAPRHTDAGAVVRPSLPVTATVPACVGAAAAPVVTEACCPGGRCEGPPEAACESAFGHAAAGLRYLELAALLGTRGPGCAELAGPAGDAPTDVDPCVSLCDGDLAGAVSALAGDLADALSCFCLDAPPADERVAVETRCLDGSCAPARLTPDAWHLDPARPDCPGGVALCLNEPAPPLTALTFSYMSGLGRGGFGGVPAASDATVDASP